MKKIPKQARRHLTGWLLAALVFLLGTSQPVARLCTLPDQLSLTEGYESRLSFPWPVKTEVDGQKVLSSIDQPLREVTDVQLSAEHAGFAQLTFKLLGWFPIKTMNVRVQPERVLVPGGQSIGVAIQMQGVLVVGASDLSGATPSPARVAGLKPGDFIETVDDVPVESAQHLSSLISGGDGVTLGIRRDGKRIEVPIQPIYDERDGVYRLGVWARDSTAGVGTLSFYDPQTNWFGALGHAITDIDTGSILAVRDGEIMNNRVVEIRKGLSGSPGELVGDFDIDAEPIGWVSGNGSYGIYGESLAPITNALYPDGIPIMSHSEVRLGAASILTTIDEAGVREFACEIVKLNDQSVASQRSLVIKVTDPELLDRTGGIVQGMSGSPILQDGRMVGAVTHVYVNDPTQGFGLYIEWMLDQLTSTDQAA